MSLFFLFWQVVGRTYKHHVYYSMCVRSDDVVLKRKMDSLIEFALCVHPHAWHAYQIAVATFLLLFPSLCVVLVQCCTRKENESNRARDVRRYSMSTVQYLPSSFIVALLVLRVLLPTKLCRPPTHNTCVYTHNVSLKCTHLLI